MNLLNLAYPGHLVSGDLDNSLIILWCSSLTTPTVVQGYPCGTPSQDYIHNQMHNGKCPVASNHTHPQYTSSSKHLGKAYSSPAPQQPHVPTTA